MKKEPSVSRENDFVMNFDPKDLIDSNWALLQEAATLKEPEEALLMTVATWGRGADPELLKALQPYRHGLGYNGSIVARVPRELALQWIPEKAREEIYSDSSTHSQMVVFSGVFKDWALEVLS